MKPKTGIAYAIGGIYVFLQTFNSRKLHNKLNKTGFRPVSRQVQEYALRIFFSDD
jgi:hypothetical protein